MFIKNFSKESLRFFSTQTLNLNGLAKKLRIANLDEWYNIRPSKISNLDESQLIDGSIIKTLLSTFPNYDWNPSKFRYFPGFLSKKENQRFLFDFYAKKLNIKSYEDWYSINRTDIEEIGQISLICKYYNGSLIRTLQSIYPEYSWKENKFKHKPRGFWSSKDNQRNFLIELTKELGLTKMDTWYSIEPKNVIDAGGRVLLDIYKGSLFLCFKTLFPEFQWKEYKFLDIQGYFLNKENRRKYMEDLSKIIGIKNMEDWYSISANTIKSNDGGPLFNLFDSLSSILADTFPEYPWDPTKFVIKESNIWKDPKIQRKFFNEIAKKYNINNLEDWYHVTYTDIKMAGGNKILQYYDGSILKALMNIYPEYNWDEDNDATMVYKYVSKSQMRVFKLLKEICPHVDIHCDYLHPEIVFPSSMQKIELDVFIPEFGLAIEYQGKQHYKELDGVPVEVRKSYDEIKKELCRENGITLIQVPYWWNGTKSMLMEMIVKLRPDLKETFVEGINK